jgi:hypothetical protein
MIASTSTQTSPQKAVHMSGNIGDKARFNRLRKQKLLKRRKKAELLAARAAAPAAEAKGQQPGE